MKNYSPDYYKKFRCIADGCKHSCCVGWDVYIDEDTAEVYRSLEGEIAEQIKVNTAVDEDGIYFKMTDDRRCPFLEKSGLCRIISNIGEGYLCDICREHPRFYNVFSDRYELGLGLCCEEAARIILSEEKPFELMLDYDDGEDREELLEEEIIALERRQAVLSILQNRKLTVDQRVEDLICKFEISFPDVQPDKWKETLISLERLDSAWDEAIDLISSNDKYASDFEIPFENLLVYFVYRHLSVPCDYYEFTARLCFSILGYKIIRWMCNGEAQREHTCTFERLCDFARMYSSEIEYSEENTKKMLALF